MGSSIKVREPAVAGAFYPGIKSSLQRTVKQLLDEAKPAEIKGRLVGLISPHAGYMYSGGVAAYGYKLLEGRSYDVVVIVAPSHHTYFKGSSVYPQAGYRTPLGIVEIDTTITGALLKEDSIDFRPEAHLREHSLEVQLPFLQYIFGEGVSFVPICISDQSYEVCESIGKTVAALAEEFDILVIASSDFTHFEHAETARKKDYQALEYLEMMDPKGFLDFVRGHNVSICGAGPIAAAMVFAKERGATTFNLLKYTNSGVVTGSPVDVVAYVAAEIL